MVDENKQETNQFEQSLAVVWVFNGARNHFPSGVFTSQQLAVQWIASNKLTGTLTAYPLNQGIYDWAIEKGIFEPKRAEQQTPFFIGNFSSASQSHQHFENGEE